MKKVINFSFAIVLVFGLLLANAPQNSVDAATNPMIADGEWNMGTEVAVDLTVTSVPSWLQLLTNGVKITAPAKICHPLRGGQFGWVGEIRHLVKGTWVKLATTNGWVPSTEGVYTACAQAPSAGTYALFGYYIKPEGPIEDIPFDCSTVEWLSVLIDITAEPEHFYYFTYFFNIPIGTPVTYKVTNVIPENNFGGALTGNGVIIDSGLVIFGTDQYLIRVDSSVDSTVTTEFSLLGCTFTDVSIRNKLDD